MSGLTIQAPSSEGAAIGILVLLFVVAFLLGSIPWGVVISRLFYKRDIRDEGSGNIGTTNAMRSLGRGAGIAVFILDFAKGVLAGLIGLAVASFLSQSSSTLGYPAVGCVLTVFTNADDEAIASAATPEAINRLCGAIAFLGCVWGHVFCPWLKFKGGKGIAVAVGCFICFAGPVYALIEVIAFIIVVAITRYVSLGSIVAALLCIVFCFVIAWGNWVSVICGVLGALTILWAHRSNMVRLVHKTENRIGSKKQDDGNEAQAE